MRGSTKPGNTGQLSLGMTQILESRDRKIRSRRRSRGRLTDLFRTASCWRSARFSAARPARERSAVRTSTTNAFTNPISSLHSTAKRSFYPSTTSKRRCCKSMRCRHDEVFSRDNDRGLRAAEREGRLQDLLGEQVDAAEVAQAQQESAAFHPRPG